jgi:hypothetical protein
MTTADEAKSPAKRYHFTFCSRDPIGIMRGKAEYRNLGIELKSFRVVIANTNIPVA